MHGNKQRQRNKPIHKQKQQKNSQKAQPAPTRHQDPQEIIEKYAPKPTNEDEFFLVEAQEEAKLVPNEQQAALEHDLKQEYVNEWWLSSGSRISFSRQLQKNMFRDSCARLSSTEGISYALQRFSWLQNISTHAQRIEALLGGIERQNKSIS